MTHLVGTMLVYALELYLSVFKWKEFRLSYKPQPSLKHHTAITQVSLTFKAVSEESSQKYLKLNLICPFRTCTEFRETNCKKKQTVQTDYNTQSLNTLAASQFKL